MKVYNAKYLVKGIAFMLLGIALAAMGFMNEFELKSFLLMLMMFVIGLNDISVSISYKRSAEYTIEELDERNRLIELKSKNLSCRITQFVCETAVLLFIIMGVISGDDRFISMGVAAAFCFSISIFAESVAEIYYKRKN